MSPQRLRQAWARLHQSGFLQPEKHLWRGLTLMLPPSPSKIQRPVTEVETRMCYTSPSLQTELPNLNLLQENYVVVSCCDTASQKQHTAYILKT